MSMACPEWRDGQAAESEQAVRDVPPFAPEQGSYECLGRSGSSQPSNLHRSSRETHALVAISAQNWQ